MKKYFYNFAPLLRGAGFNGEKGKIIRFISDKEKITRLCDFYKNDILILDIKEELLESGYTEKLTLEINNGYKNHLNKTGREPVIISLNKDSLFITGENYKAIEDLLECKADAGKLSHLKKEIIESTDRNKIAENKVSIVTGGAQGIGKEIVTGLAEAGSLVFIADININGANKLSEELNKKYSKTVSFPVQVNITDEDSVKNMVREVVRLVGGIDIFISNAGVLKADSVMKMELKDFSFVNSVNYTGYFLCTKYVSGIMKLQNMITGKYFTDIIQINSKSGLSGSKNNSAYAGSKFGSIGLTQSFALELVEHNIKVNSVCPGNFFDGPLWSDPDKGLFAQYLKVGKVPGAKTFEQVKKYYESKVPMKRGCTGKDLMKAILYIVDQKYETGQAVPVTGGQIMLK